MQKKMVVKKLNKYTHTSKQHIQSLGILEKSLKKVEIWDLTNNLEGYC